MSECVSVCVCVSYLITYCVVVCAAAGCVLDRLGTALGVRILLDGLGGGEYSSAVVQ